MRRVLITGCSGFVGRAVCAALLTSGYTVRCALRSPRSGTAGPMESVIVGDIRRDTDWGTALDQVELVIHLAARAHVLNDSTANAGLYNETNALGTSRLAAAAAAAGVRRFVYLSSVKVNGEETTKRPFSAFDEPHPLDHYGESKWLGEKGLFEVAQRTGMEAVIVRSPLVYGPGVRANFLRLMRWVDRERPLPLGAICNARSLISIWNLTHLLLHVMEHSAGAGKVWMVSDGEDLSTPDLIRHIGRAMNRTVRLFPVPSGLLRLGGRLMGKGPEVARLCGSLAVDIERTRDDLNWAPPLSVEESIARTVTWYLSEGVSGAR